MSAQYGTEIRLLPENEEFYDLLTFILQANHSFVL